ncbi:helix-turn-helix transcriptional regulator [Winogradskyella forsetii]|uniref:helix-turn-helix transcriptional regulator n=1 Tax=Winogradskyella forsetii TaxID=2686077 RepID=UPI0015BE41A9|nr:LuxR C-terminal-related transcriptional regulator [Winogradskyella forsetii]
MLVISCSDKFKNVVLILFFLYASTSFGQHKESNGFYRFLDSADIYVSENPKRAQSFLDSIPESPKGLMEGKLAEFYQLKALVSDGLNEEAKKFHYFMLALRYAKLEKNHTIAGMASLELFYITYIVKNDTTAFKYLEDAKTYYTLENNTNGLAEVMQMPAYVEFYKTNYKKSNQLILEHLEDYKKIEDDGYYYMYALFMLCNNYKHLHDLKNAHKYLNLLKGLQNDKTISPSLHTSHLATAYNCLAEVHLEKKAVDSSFYYLLKARELGKFMNNTDRENHYTLFADYYENIADVDNKKVYVDSLKYLHEQNLKENIEASIQINDELLNSENQLEIETNKKNINKYLVLGLIGVLLAVSAFITVRYKTNKKKLKSFSKRDKEFSYLQTNHEKLKVKVRGLEDFITEVKKEVKQIATISDTAEQRNEIRKLYKNIYHNSSTLLNKGESHLELINELNVEFFNKINSIHPELNHSEVIICYYIFTGFKNKEIAAFLNSSNRAVESKRYRISKKLSIQEKEITLIDYLQKI